MNCLLNVFVICLGIVDVLLLNLMMFFRVWWVLYCLTHAPYMVLHNVCVFCLWSHCLVRCSLQMYVLCCMREVISEFGIMLIFGVYSVSELEPLSDVFRQQLACFMHFAFWNMVFVCWQNNVVIVVCG